MSCATNYLEEMVLNVFRGIDATAFSSLWLELLTSEPNEDGTGATPPSYSGYARKQISFTPPAPLSGGIGFMNDSEIEFARALEDGPSVTHVAVYNSQTGGVMLLKAPLNSEKQIRSGIAPVIRINEAKFWLTGDLSNYCKQKILNLFRGQNFAGITPYVTLFNGDPEGNGTELAGGNFARQPITFTAPVELPNGQRIISNATDISFPAATVYLGAYNYDCIFDGVSSSNLLAKKIGQTDTYGIGDVTRYYAGNLSITIN